MLLALILIALLVPAAFYAGYRYGTSRAYDDILDTLRAFEEDNDA